MKFTTPTGAYIWPEDYISEIICKNDEWTYIIPRAAHGNGKARADAVLLERKGGPDLMAHRYEHDPVWLLMSHWQYALVTADVSDIRELLQVLSVVAMWDHRRIISNNLNSITYALKNVGDLLDVESAKKEITLLQAKIADFERAREDHTVEESRARQDAEYLAISANVGTKNVTQK